MKMLLSTTTLALVLCMAGGVLAQETNDQTRHDAVVQTAQQHKADKAQAKADKAEHKALKSHKVKKAARKQDEANRQADKTPAPQQ